MKSLALNFITNSSTICTVIIFQKVFPSVLKDADFYFKKHFEELFNDYTNNEQRDQLEEYIRNALTTFIATIQNLTSSIVHMKYQSCFFDINNQVSSHLTELDSEEAEILKEALEDMLHDAGYVKRLIVEADDEGGSCPKVTVCS